MKNEISRPIMSEYSDIRTYVTDMLYFRKCTEKNFSVLQACARLRRVSPTLISLIKKGERIVTVDRVQEFAKLLNLSAEEKKHFTHWVELESRDQTIAELKPFSLAPQGDRKEVSVGILSDWVNVYVKDLFQIPEYQKKPDLIYTILAPVASPTRIDKSIRFLLREGHLKKTPQGKVVSNNELSVADPRVPSEKIRKFHKGALQWARQAIDSVSPENRLANCLIVPLNKKSYYELMDLIDEFSEKLQGFAENQANDGDHLFQLIVNVSPIGGQE